MLPRTKARERWILCNASAASYFSIRYIHLTLSRQTSCYQNSSSRWKKRAHLRILKSLVLWNSGLQANPTVLQTRAVHVEMFRQICGKGQNMCEFQMFNSTPSMRGKNLLIVPRILYCKETLKDINEKVLFAGMYTVFRNEMLNACFHQLFICRLNITYY